MRSRFSFYTATALLLALGAVGGWGASRLGLPMPWLIGALLMAALMAGPGAGALPVGYRFPQAVREPFIALIGVSIGAQVQPELLRHIAGALPSLLAITLFVPLAHGLGYAVFRRVGGYDRVTAYYAAAPGGLIEALTLGEAAGADLTKLTLQQFLRIIIVIAGLPLLISLIEGRAVGSAAGLMPAQGPSALPLWAMLVLVALVALIGRWLGRRLHLPAAQLIGPLLAAAAVNLTGLVTLSVPVLLILGSQVVIGVSLGMRFIGLTRRTVAGGAVLAALSVGAMLGLGALLALGLMPLTGLQFDVLLISFAPGGVIEMALIALSLHANPALVTLHHLWRITLTVLLMGPGAARLGITPPRRPPQKTPQAPR